jgi:hypothetical protein
VDIQALLALVKFELAHGAETAHITFLDGLLIVRRLDFAIGSYLKLPIVPTRQTAVVRVARVAREYIKEEDWEALGTSVLVHSLCEPCIKEPIVKIELA